MYFNNSIMINVGLYAYITERDAMIKIKKNVYEIILLTK